jgi:non-canonical poly(A) RNA polymerase PAPD5/7
MSPLPEEIQQRESLIQLIQTFISNLFTEVDESGQSHSSCSISVFGSQAAGLILPSSDIDMVVFFKPSDSTSGKDASNPIVIDGKETDTPPDTDASNNIDYKPLIQMYEAFRDSEEWKDQLTYLELILESRIPLLKFTYGPSNISVDISMEQPLGPQAATLCLQYMDALPALRPLTMVLKYFLLARGLNEPFSGGMGSYALLLMIVSFLQQREREERQRNRSVSRKGSSHNNNASVGGMNLGGLLLDFLELYGFDFNYIMKKHSMYLFLILLHTFMRFNFIKMIDLKFTKFCH